METKQPKYISAAFHKKLSRSQVLPKDLLINLVGASIGRACIVPVGFPEANVNQAVAVVTIDPNALLPQVALHFLLSSSGQKILLGNIVEAARANISLTDIKELEVPIPARAAQLEFDTALRQVQIVEEAMLRGAAEFDALFASVQHRAFRGEL